MRQDLQEATTFFYELPPEFRYPTLNPKYVANDCIGSKSVRPVFFCERKEEGIFYHATKEFTNQNSIGVDREAQRGYGGPLAIGSERYIDDVFERYYVESVESGVLAEFFRFTPLLDNHSTFRYDAVYDRETVWIDLENQTIENGYQSRARGTVRRALKNGATCYWATSEDDWLEFFRLYTDRMNDIKAEKSYFFNENYFIGLKQIKSANLILCYKDKEVIGGAIILIDGDYAEYHLSAVNQSGFQLGATALLIDQSASFAKEKQCKKFHLGGGTDGEEDNKLLFFKSSFSILRSKFYFGKCIFNAKKYASLQSKYMNQGKQVNQVLFYR